LEQNPDILAGLVAARRASGSGPQVIVGFAAETGDESGSILDHARAKAQRKGADLLGGNRVGVGVGFGDIDSAVTVLTSDGEVWTEAAGSKTDIAHALWDAINVRVGR